MYILHILEKFSSFSTITFAPRIMLTIILITTYFSGDALKLDAVENVKKRKRCVL
jgi:hypothetical protein